MNIGGSEKGPGFSRLLTFLTVLIFIGVALSQSISSTTPEGRVPEVRVEDRLLTALTTFKGDTTQEGINFDASGAPNRTVYLEIPREAIIMDVEVTMDPSSLFFAQGAATIHDLSLTTSQGWFGHLSNPSTKTRSYLKNPTNPGPPQENSFPITPTEIPMVSAIDLTYLDSETRYSNGESSYVLARFNLTELDTQTVGSIEVFWIGRGLQDDNSPPKPLLSMISTMYIYDVNNNNWDQVHQGIGSVMTQQDYVMNKPLPPSMFNDYVATSTGRQIYVLIEAPQDTIQATLPHSMLKTDYMSVNVTTGANLFPSSPALDIGDDGTDEWNISGIFQTPDTIDEFEYPDLVTSIQSVIDAAPSTDATVDVPLALSSAQGGAITLKNLIINYRVNTPPVLTPPFTNGSFSLTEDLPGGENLINLGAYFHDDDVIYGDSLRFEVIYEEDNTILDATLNGSFLTVTQVKPNWFGRMDFKIRAYDNGTDRIANTEDDVSVDSNLFFVKVNPDNDPPAFETINGLIVDSQSMALTGERALIQGERGNFVMTYSDIDSDKPDLTTNITLGDAGYELLTSFEPYSSTLTFLPTNNDVGKIFINLTLDDLNGSAAYLELVIDVVNVNDPPVLTVQTYYLLPVQHYRIGR